MQYRVVGQVGNNGTDGRGVVYDTLSAALRDVADRLDDAGDGDQRLVIWPGGRYRFWCNNACIDLIEED